MAETPPIQQPANSLAARIVKEREKRRWTQKKLVEMTKLRPKLIYELENGGMPSLETLATVAKAFDMSAEELTRGTERTVFSAPLGKSVKITILIATIVLVAIAFNPLWEITALVFAVYAGCLLFSVQGYEVKNGILNVQRLLWKTKIPLAGLESATVDKDVLSHALRLFGNGGLFAYTGFYKSARLGSFRAYVTDKTRAVVLKIGGRIIVISPDAPESFVHMVKTTAKGEPR